MEVGAVLNYYIRRGLSRHLSKTCTELLRKRPDDAVLLFWRCFSLIMENSYSEALRELSQLQGRREIDLCTLIAMVHAHRSARIIDEEAVRELEARIAEAESRATEPGLVQAATLLWHLGSCQRSMGMAEKVLRTQPNSEGARCLLAWVSITPGEDDENVDGGSLDEYARSAIESFAQLAAAGTGGKRTLESLMGMAGAHEMLREYRPALEVVAQMGMDYPWFLPSLVVKARLLMHLRDWDGVLEAVQAVLSQDEGNLEALEILAAYALSQDSDVKRARSSVERLAAAVESREPRNAPLYHRLSRTVSRLAAGDAQVLRASLRLIARARELSPQSAEYATEQGHQQLEAGNLRAAGDCFHEAQSLDELNMGGVHGSIESLIWEGKLEDAAEQIAFLKEMIIGDEKPAKLMYYSGMISCRRPGALLRPSGADALAAIDELDECYADHLREIRAGATDRPLCGFIDEATALDPPFMLGLCREYLSLCTGSPRTEQDAPSAAASGARSVLDRLLECCPGLLPARTLYALACFYDGDVEAAVRVAAACVGDEPSYVECYAVLAAVHVHQGKLRMAEQVIEQAMGHDFTVKETPVYHLVRARVLQADGRHEDAVRALQGALALPRVRSSDHGAPGRYFRGISLSDRVTLHLALAEAHQAAGQLHEATKVVQDAMAAFAGTPEETRVVLANSELVLARGDTAEALEALGAVPVDSPHYVRARSAMAQVYLRQHNDKTMFARCYEDLVRQQPSVTSYCTLGEALMQIQESEKAIAAFEAAYRLEPTNASLSSRLGRALIATHDYARAVAYYHEAMRSSGDAAGGVNLQIELAELYVRIKRYEEASATIDGILARPKGSADGSDAGEMMTDVRALLLLASIYESSEEPRKAYSAREDAKRLQLSLLQRMLHEQPEEQERQRRLAADICYMLGCAASSGRRYDEAVAILQEGLELCEGHIKSMIALSKLHLLRNEMAEAHSQCTSILRHDAGNEEATVMLAELMFQKEMYETSIYHYEQLLERPAKPGQDQVHCRALSKLIQLMRRAGRLEEVPAKIAAAERAGGGRASTSPGLHFCRGLSFRYASNPREALKEFSSVRNNGEWGVEATFQMVEIYINPDNDSMATGLASGGAAGGAADADAAAGAPAGASGGGKESAAAAMQLLNEVRSRRQGTPRFVVLEAYAMMATGERADLEAALQSLLTLAQSDSESVPVLLALATAYTMLRQVPKARNQLKRVAKMPYNVEEADEFERSWLMLAEVHIAAGKFDLAHEMCVRCIKYNKSCARAWEHMGAIMEREQSYANAAENYENAWRHDNEAVCRVGYKLAFNLLKCKEYVRAIDVCHKVLAQDADYPKIRHDVLEKAWQGLRP